VLPDADVGRSAVLELVNPCVVRRHSALPVVAGAEAAELARYKQVAVPSAA
jgi:hypothetical protein